MYYVDDKGKVLDIQTPLTEALNAVIEDYFDMLSKMTAEQRLNYFKYEQFVEPLRYTQDIDNTTYVVRTHFNQNADKTILKKTKSQLCTADYPVMTRTKAYRAQSKIKQKFYNNTLPKTVSKILAFS